MSEAILIRDFMAKQSREVASLATRRIGLSALSGLVLRTPVDTGRARGNWTVSLGSPNGAEGQEDKSGAGTIASGGSIIAGQRGFQQIVIENNIPYIGRLNEGHSKQAPAGFVESTLASLGVGLGRD